MQPTYLPWIGYFGLMMSVDLFVILDNVQFSHRSWQQRNQIKTPQGICWLSVPVLIKGRRDQLIRDVLIDQTSNFQKKHKSSIELAYKKTPYFDDFFPIIDKTFSQKNNTLLETNIALIDSIMGYLNIKKKLVFASNFNCIGSKADLLSNLCEQLGANEYISAPGSRDYIEQSIAFQSKKIKVNYFDYIHPEYNQIYGEFIPFMSVIDLIFNEGPAAYKIINTGIKNNNEL